MLATTTEPTAEQSLTLTLTRDRDGMLAALGQIDQQGWDGDAATDMLRFVREQLVRPLVVDVGLRGAAADQAESTGWATAWEVLADPRLRQAESPWGVVWTAVRRSVLAEQMSASYGTNARAAWRAARLSPAGPWTPPPVSLDELAGAGWELADQSVIEERDLGPLLDLVVDALASVGWSRHDAERLVAAIAALVRRQGTRPTEVAGWRHVVAEVDLPPWQVRRVSVLVVGVPGWPGLLERLVLGGECELDAPGVVAALRSTLCRWHRSPVLAARRATEGRAA